MSCLTTVTGCHLFVNINLSSRYYRYVMLIVKSLCYQTQHISQATNSLIISSYDDIIESIIKSHPPCQCLVWGNRNQRDVYKPHTLHIEHLSTPLAQQFYNCSHVFFWYFHSGNLHGSFTCYDYECHWYKKSIKCLTVSNTVQKMKHVHVRRLDAKQDSYGNCIKIKVLWQSTL